MFSSVEDLPTELTDNIIEKTTNIVDISRFSLSSKTTLQIANNFFSRDPQKLKLLTILKDLGNLSWWQTGKLEDRKNDFIQHLMSLWNLSTPCNGKKSPQDYFFESNLLELVVFRHACDLEARINQECILSEAYKKYATEYTLCKPFTRKWEIKKMSSLLKNVTQTPNAIYIAIPFRHFKNEREKIAQLFNLYYGKQKQIAFFDSKSIDCSWSSGITTGLPSGDHRVYFRADLFCKYVLEKILDQKNLIDINQGNKLVFYKS